MITAFTGGIIMEGQDKGNGKTATMTFSLAFAKYPHLRFRYDSEQNAITLELGKPIPEIEVFTNYKVTFADRILSPSEISDLFGTGTLKNCVIGIDEMQVLWDSHFGMSKNSVKNKLQRLVQQSRKRNVAIYYTTQRYKNVHAVLRRHTNLVCETVKRHYTTLLSDGDDICYESDGDDICYDDQCYRPHYVEVYDLDFRRPTWRWPMECIFPFFDSDEIIFDEQDKKKIK